MNSDSPRPIRVATTEQKNAAYKIYDQALRTGKLVRGSCLICGTKEKIHGHHEDYSAPLDVIWLCYRHHFRWHVLARMIATERFVPMP